jgi:hypothetical protein
MLKIPNSVPVKTRLPLSAWAVAGALTLFSLLSSALHLAPLGHEADADAKHSTRLETYAASLPDKMTAAAGLIMTVR